MELLLSYSSVFGQFVGEHEIRVRIPPFNQEPEKRFLTVPWVFYKDLIGGYMDRVALAKMYIDSVQNNEIDSATLAKIPELVTCNDWAQVEIVGVLNYISERTKIVYNGLLIKHAGGLYYIKKKLVDALGNIDRRFRNVKKSIRVIS